MFPNNKVQIGAESTSLWVQARHSEVLSDLALASNALQQNQTFWRIIIRKNKGGFNTVNELLGFALIPSRHKPILRMFWYISKGSERSRFFSATDPGLQEDSRTAELYLPLNHRFSWFFFSPPLLFSVPWNPSPLWCLHWLSSPSISYEPFTPWLILELRP